MSDERFNDAIRDALLADDPGTVPVRLKARMATIPNETAGDVVASPWRDRFARFGMPMGVLAAAAIIVVVFGGIALRGQQAASVAPSAPSKAPSSVPSAEPSADASASAATSSSPSAAPSPSATPEPSSSATATPQPSPLPTGPIALDPAKVIGLSDGTFALQGTTALRRWVTDTVSYPLLGTYDTQTSGSADGSARSVVVLDNGHDIAAQAITDAGFVWMETWYTDKPINCADLVPCSPHGGQPVSWALNLTTLDGKTTKLDGGVVTRLSVEGEGSTPLPPEIAAQGNRVAYAVPHTVAGEPQASRIIVRSLPDGALVRTIDTKGYVAQLGLFGQTLIYRRATDTTGPSDPSNAYLNVVADDASQPATLDGPVAQASIGDGGAGGTVRIAWMPGYGVTPGLRWVTLGETAFHTVAVVGGAQSMFDPVVIGRGFAWLASVENGDGTSTAQVQVWEPGWPKARVATSLGSPNSIISSDGRLLFSGTEVPVLQPLGVSEGAISAADLFSN